MDMFQKFLGDFPVTWNAHVWLAEGKPNYRLNWYEYDFKLKWIEATDTLENSKFRGFTYRGYPSFLLTYCDGQPNIKPVF